MRNNIRGGNVRTKILAAFVILCRIKRQNGGIFMKLLACLKNEKLLCFAGGIFAATYGVKALKSDKTRNTCAVGAYD